MAETKTFAEWEKEKNVMHKSADQAHLSQQMTEAEFVDYFMSNRDDMHAVDYSGRIAFLQQNGYELTRANMINSELSARTPKQIKDAQAAAENNG